MKFTFTMEGRLESLNETLRIPKYRFFKLKKRRMVKRQIALWILYSNVPKFENPVKIHMHWVEKDKRRDRDNIRSGAKLILDALVRQERIRNDSQKWLVSLTDSYDVDKANPRIEVTIEDAFLDVPTITTTTLLRAPETRGDSE